MAPPPAMKGQGMIFAEKQLHKHGWTEGKGLGRRENGISEAIKVKVKCDTAGVGHNSAEQFTFHWWDHVFNKTASGISVESDQDGVQVKKCPEDTAVTNKKPRKALMSRDMLYGRFIKSATLLSGGEKPVEKESSSESSGDEDEKLDLSSATRLTDEDLMRVCGGRTAHKGARHGLTMSAKLSRIEEQERAFLEKYGKKEPKNEPIKPNGDASSVNKERRKTTHSREAMGEATQDSSSNITWVKKKKKQKKSEDVVINDGDQEKSKQKDKTSKKKRAELLEDVNSLYSYEEDTPTSKKKKVDKEVTDDLDDHVQFSEDDLKGSKKKVVKEVTEDIDDHVQFPEDYFKGSKKKKKKKDKDVREMANDLEDQASSDKDRPRKKKSADKEVCEIVNDLEDQDFSGEGRPWKKKKKKKVTGNEEWTEEPSNGHQEMVPSGEVSQKSSKKKKHVNLNDMDEQEPDESTENHVKPKKKQKENKVLEFDAYDENMENEEDLKKKKSKTRPSTEAVDGTEHHIKRKKKRKAES